MASGQGTNPPLSVCEEENLTNVGSNKNPRLAQRTHNDGTSTLPPRGNTSDDICIISRISWPHAFIVTISRRLHSPTNIVDSLATIEVKRKPKLFFAVSNKRKDLSESFQGRSR